MAQVVAAGAAAVRLGHPARVHEELLALTLDGLAARHRQSRTLRQWRVDAAAAADQLAKGGLHRGERDACKAQLRDLRRDCRELERSMVEDVLDRHPVHCATLTHLDSRELGSRQYSLAVIDEACQSAEPATWLPLLRADRVVFAGDHCQLPPTVIAPGKDGAALAVSLMERLLALHGADAIGRMLTTQYRMHEDIMFFSSLQFYDGRLEAAPTVAARLLADLDGVESSELTTMPIAYIDTAGADFGEEQEPGGGSWRNAEEAKLLVSVVQAHVDAGLSPAAILVVSPYAAQVRDLNDRLEGSGVEVTTIDGCQGRENELVLLSLVRSNPEKSIGFLQETRRMNVALTRARRKLVVIGDSATLSGHDFYEQFFDHVDALGAYQSAWEYD
jgi:predicted DNA helicase